jgi:hypothetical protein
MLVRMLSELLTGVAGQGVFADGVGRREGKRVLLRTVGLNQCGLLGGQRC